MDEQTLILKFNLLEDIFPTSIPKEEFTEFCNDLDSLYSILDEELYMEAFVSGKKDLGDTISTIASNTKDNTVKTLKAYGDVTDAGGSLGKGVVDLISSAVGLISKIIGFFLKNLSKIPTFIAKCINMISQIPQEVRNLIRGNIKLYITAQDLQHFYNNIFPEIATFISLTKDMSSGEMWGTFFNRDKKNLSFPTGKNDMEIYRAMKKSFSKLKGNVRFEPSVIEMKDDMVRNLYFGNIKNLKFTAINNATTKSLVNKKSTTDEVVTSYHSGLLRLVEELDTFREPLSNVQKLISEKYNRTQANQTFARLSPAARENVKESILMVSKVVNIVGGLLTCINRDVETFNRTTAQILKKATKPVEST